MESTEQDETGTRENGKFRVRRKIRFKKKRSKKRKYKKYIEYGIWIVLVIAFLISLIILVKQMDITDEKSKKKKQMRSELSICPSVDLSVLAGSGLDAVCFGNCVHVT